MTDRPPLVYRTRPLGACACGVPFPQDVTVLVDDQAKDEATRALVARARRVWRIDHELPGLLLGWLYGGRLVTVLVKCRGCGQTAPAPTTLVAQDKKTPSTGGC